MGQRFLLFPLSTIAVLMILAGCAGTPKLLEPAAPAISFKKFNQVN